MSIVHYGGWYPVLDKRGGRWGGYPPLIFWRGGGGTPLSWEREAPPSPSRHGRITGSSDGDSMRTAGPVDAGMGGWYPVLRKTGGEGVPPSLFGEGVGIPPLIFWTGGYPPFPGRTGNRVFRRGLHGKQGSGGCRHGGWEPVLDETGGWGSPSLGLERGVPPLDRWGVALQ